MKRPTLEKQGTMYSQKKFKKSKKTTSPLETKSVASDYVNNEEEVLEEIAPTASSARGKGGRTGVGKPV